MRFIAIMSAAVLSAAAGSALAQTAPEPLLRVVVAPGAVQAAPDPARQAHLDLAQRYLELTQSGDLIKQVRRQMEDSYESTDLPADQRAWLVENFSGMLTEVVNATLVELRDDVADSFTVQELEAALAFYESAVGRSLIRKQGEMNMAMQQLMMPMLLPRMTALMEKFCLRFDCAAMGEAATKNAR